MVGRILMSVFMMFLHWLTKPKHGSGCRKNSQWTVRVRL